MSESNHRLFRLRFLRCAVVVCALIAVCAAARAVTLEEVAAVYAKQLDLLQPYRLRYKETITWPQDDGTDKTVTRVVELLVDKLRYKESIWTETGAEGQLEPVMTETETETDNGTERRHISHGGRGIGQIMSPQSAMGIHLEMMHTPLGLAGLLDSSVFEAQGDRSLQSGPSDVRALALQPEAALLASPEVLDGKQAYVIEWPKSTPHPKVRLWLSADEKLSLLKGEVYRHSPNGEYVLMSRTINRDFREIRPGLFLPTQSEIQFQGIEAPPSTHQYEFVSIDIGVPVTDQDFLLEFSDGMLVNRRFTWGDRDVFIENWIYEKLRILVGVCLLIMAGTVGFVVYRSLRKVR